MEKSRYLRYRTLVPGPLVQQRLASIGTCAVVEETKQLDWLIKNLRG